MHHTGGSHHDDQRCRHDRNRTENFTGQFPFRLTNLIVPTLLMKHLAIPLIKRLAIPLSNQPKNFWPGTRKTVAKWLVIGCQRALHSHSAKSPKDGDISRWLTTTKCTRRRYAVVVRGSSPNNTRRLVIRANGSLFNG